MMNRRAISPIISAILLIGLAVIGGAVLMIMVLPMLDTSRYGSISVKVSSNQITIGNGYSDELTITNIRIDNHNNFMEILLQPTNNYIYNYDYDNIHTIIIYYTIGDRNLEYTWSHAT